MHYSPIQSRPDGIALNVFSSFLFALMYGYVGVLKPLTGEEIYGWRILLTIPCLTVMLVLMGSWGEIKDIVQRLIHERLFWAKRLISSFLLGIQLWLFMWAPVNGYALDVSLGYFLLPIALVVLGRIAFKERVTPLQLVACFLACIGIINELFATESVSWPAFVVCAGYTVYFWLRRVLGTSNLGGLWFDMVLSLPVSLFFVFSTRTIFHSQSHVLPSFPMPLLIIGLGVISTSALALSTLSSKKLSMPLFGLLSYVEPFLLVLASLILGESIAPSQWPTYIAIWLAVVMLIIEGVIVVYKSLKRA